MHTTPSYRALMRRRHRDCAMDTKPTPGSCRAASGSRSPGTRQSRRRPPRRAGRRSPTAGRERAVAASVVEHPPAAKTLRQRDADVEAAAVAPGDQPILAKDLLRGVMTFAQGGIDGRLERVKTSSPALPSCPAS